MKNKSKSPKKFSRKNERLNLAKLIIKLDLMARIRRSVAVFKANKYVKRHRREKIIALLLLAIIMSSTNTLRDMNNKFFLALLGDKDMPSRSTISRTMEKINARSTGFSTITPQC